MQRVLLCSDCRDLRVQLQRKGTRADGLEGNYGGTLSFPGRSGRADPLLLARKDLAGTRFLAVGTRRVQLVRRDGRDVSTLYGRVCGGGGVQGSFVSGQKCSVTALVKSRTRNTRGHVRTGGPRLVQTSHTRLGRGVRGRRTSQWSVGSSESRA